MTLLVLSSLHSKFSADYSANLDPDTLAKPRRCHFTIRTGAATEYSVSLTKYWVAVPLDLVFQEDEEDRFPHSHGLKRYRSEIIADGCRAARLMRRICPASAISKRNAGDGWLAGRASTAGISCLRPSQRVCPSVERVECVCAKT
jgi:hypothetical protein